MTVALVDLGYGNIGSIEIALRRLGAEVARTADADAIRKAERVVLPGVGAAGYAMGRIDALGLRGTLTALRQPLLGICLGMQLLFEASEEDDEAGLGILPGVVRRLPEAVRVPHMGWNTVSWAGRRHPFVADIPDQTSFYFVHSYAPDLGADVVGATEHGRTFAAVVARDTVFATQFHPEKSGDAGLQLYANIVREVAA